MQAPAIEARRMTMSVLGRPPRRRARAARKMIPWIASAGTLLAVWLSGRNLRLSWKVSLLNQAVWLVFIVAYKAWGLLPLTLALAGIFARHLWRTRDGQRPTAWARSSRTSRTPGARTPLAPSRPAFLG